MSEVAGGGNYDALYESKKPTASCTNCGSTNVIWLRSQVVSGNEPRWQSFRCQDCNTEFAVFG